MVNVGRRHTAPAVGAGVARSAGRASNRWIARLLRRRARNDGDEIADLIHLAAQPDQHVRAHIRMQGHACQHALQLSMIGTADLRRTAIGMRQGDDAIDVGVGRQAIGREVLRDGACHVRRAIHGRDQARYSCACPRVRCRGDNP